MGIGLHSFLQLKNMEIGQFQTTTLCGVFLFLARHYRLLSFGFEVKELLLAGTIQLDIKNGSGFREEYSPA